MSKFSPHTYFRNLVAQSTKFTPDTNTEDDHFSRASSIIAIDEFLSEMSEISGLQFILQDTRSARLMDKYSDNLLINQYFSFYILQSASQGDYDEKENVLSSTYQALLHVISRMFNDKILYFTHIICD